LTQFGQSEPVFAPVVLAAAPRRAAPIPVSAMSSSP
jgi:hypothetical protein